MEKFVLSKDKVVKAMRKRGILNTSVLGQLAGLDACTISRSYGERGVSGLTAKKIAIALNTTIPALMDNQLEQQVTPAEGHVLLDRDKIEKIMLDKMISSYREISLAAGFGSNYLSSIFFNGCLAKRRAAMRIANALGVNIDDIASADQAPEEAPRFVVINQFIDERTKIQASGRIKTTDLFSRYLAYCEETNNPPATRNDFYACIRAKGFNLLKSNGSDYWFGIALEDTTEDTSETDSDAISDGLDQTNQPSIQSTNKQTGESDNNGNPMLQRQLILREVKDINTSFKSLFFEFSAMLTGIHQEQVKQTELLERLVQAWEK